MSESTCKHIVMNGGINFVSSQKVENPQVVQTSLVICNLKIL